MASAKVIGRPLEVMIEGCKLAKMDFLSLSGTFGEFALLMGVLFEI